MRVLMLANAVEPDQLGGLHRYVSRLSGALVARGIEVSVLTKRRTDELPPVELRDDGVRVLRYLVPAKSSPAYAASYPLATLRAGLRELRQLPASAIVHGHYPLQALAPRIARRRYVYTFHAPVHRELLMERAGSYLLPGPTQKPAVAAVRALERTVVAGASQLVVLSRHARQEVRALDAGAGERAAVVPGGIDLDRFSDTAPMPEAVQPGAGPLLFTARRLTSGTGVLQLVAAMSLIRRQLPDARLAIAGSGPAEAELRRNLAQGGLGNAVRLLGTLSEGELPRWYRAADLVVIPSQELEAFGLSTVEALACGTPVVATPVGANRELLEDLDQRLLASGPDAEALARAVIRVLGDPDLLHTARAGARQAVAPQMGWPQVAEAYHDLYRRLATGS